MRLWWEVARRSFRRHSTYRAAVFAGVLTNTVFGCVRAYVLLAVFAQRPEIGGYDATDAVTFTFITQGLIMATGGFQPLELGERIRTGDIALDLHRPVDLQAWWLISDLGRSAYHVLVRGAVPVVVGAVLFDLRWPAVTSIPAFIVALALGITVSFAIRYLSSLACFWIIDERGVTFTTAIVGWLLSGLFLPLTLFPESIRDVALVQPWAMVMQTPIDIWLGKTNAASGTFFSASSGSVVLLVAGGLVTRLAVRKVVVQGG